VIQAPAPRAHGGPRPCRRGGGQRAAAWRAPQPPLARLGQAPPRAPPGPPRHAAFESISGRHLHRAGGTLTARAATPAPLPRRRGRAAGAPLRGACPAPPRLACRLPLPRPLGPDRLPPRLARAVGADVLRSAVPEHPPPVHPGRHGPAAPWKGGVRVGGTGFAGPRAAGFPGSTAAYASLSVRLWGNIAITPVIVHTDSVFREGPRVTHAPPEQQPPPEGPQELVPPLGSLGGAPAHRPHPTVSIPPHPNDGNEARDEISPGKNQQSEP